MTDANRPFPDRPTPDPHHVDGDDPATDAAAGSADGSLIDSPAEARGVGVIGPSDEDLPEHGSGPHPPDVPPTQGEADGAR